MSSQGDWGYVDSDGNYTGGHSGSEASRDRAVGEARSGRVQKRQQQVWNAVRLAGLTGMTWAEVATTMGCHHGAASGALSNLHKAGRVERLKERRGGSSVYVLPHAVNGRETAPFGRVRASKPPVEVLGHPEPQEAAEAVAAARQEGYDTGWQEGYDEAAAAVPASNMLAEALRTGRQEGRSAAKASATRVITEMYRLASQSSPVQTHDDRCFTRHPACALKAAIKAVEKA